MTTVSPVAPAPAATDGARPTSRRAWGLLVLAGVIAVLAVLSIAVGSRAMGLGEVWTGLTDPASDAHTVVTQMRLPRTALGLAAGAALGLAGALMQAMTRNPLADPGLLGVNTGAAAAVVTAAYFFGFASFTQTIGFAFAGAAIAAVGCYLIAGAASATPARLALAGAAVTAAGYAYVSAVQILDAATLEQMRFWSVGSLVNAPTTPVLPVVILIAVAAIAGLVLARPLNALALGDATATGLGVDPRVLRVAGIAAITVLAGTATAVCGPIVFVGLVVPHVVRAFTGPDQNWVLPYSALTGAAFLLAADVLGRVIARPAEVQVGIVCAVAGGPFFLYLISRRRVASL
ncbi:FecCD family ABC transporter permease [Glycomyces buryatensis]|uniref:Iron ABC transporter permease n=1 Tax=Glycomyces buryatensis TaxID=2570927 RepID=A0A4S8PZ91_9ACTN|nr:iron ABC transporter permease [Glycomyces buryatensis]THV37077.1 iron ABC transporter permease [Glycomyces buryatensis]